MCQRFTLKTTKEPVASQHTSGVDWEEVNINLFGPMPDKRHILVVQDAMSRFPAAKIVPNTSAPPVVKALDDVYTSYGRPQRHRTDNGPPFSSAEFARYSNENGIEQVLAYPYHPQGNPAETFMKPLGKAVKAALYNRDCAQQAVDNLLKSYRSTPHPATGLPPGNVLFRYGYNTEFPTAPCSDEDVMAGVLKDEEQKRQRTEHTNASVKRRKSHLQPGDRVILKDYPKGQKFDPLYDGEVVEVVEVEERGVVVRDSYGDTKRRHMDDVKPFYLVSPWFDEWDQDMSGNNNDERVDPEVVMEEAAGQATAETATSPVLPPRRRKLPTKLDDYEVYGLKKNQ